MQRFRSKPRPDWQKTVESQGLLFHSPEGETYGNNILVSVT